MDTERVESVLFRCRKALKLLCPRDGMDKDIVLEAYKEAGKLLIELEDAAQPAVQADAEIARLKQAIKKHGQKMDALFSESASYDRGIKISQLVYDLEAEAR
uniref:Uncharacterized protein n=1 Tax=viral metagenome TaxID=1070528 RepID=A0A6M3Y0P2_9ZZZZ